MSARRSQTRNGGTMPAACFDVRPSPSPAVPCRDYSNTGTLCKALSSTTTTSEVLEAHTPKGACFDVPNIPGSGAEPRVVPFAPADGYTTRSGACRQVGNVAASLVADIALARAKKRAGQ